MGNLSWFGRKARTGRTLLLSVMLLMAVALSGAIVPASAQAAPSHVASSGVALHLVVSRHSPVSSAETLNTSVCIPPAGTICVGTGASNGRCAYSWADIVNAANHSVWENFRSEIGFNPKCVDASNSGSAIWLENEPNEPNGFANCIERFSGPFLVGTETIFFIRYNSPCGNEPGSEPS